ncbi:MAG: bifunctional glutamate N-acetyltransferase/amino-acid acetyltransferase ArgJ [Planctomycetota bacterium]|nr:bifunctional glutamate N-acetyltransferase/amino-acid acetyltransferase ArgJ [Planctomycetota bacterium]MDA1262806.1 bifunctional glutamate N-acetyltransferase/amino-acid acetyltransferase ArgJ [Planctomycetota bacterium]
MTSTPPTLLPTATPSTPRTTVPEWPRGFSSGGVAAGIKKQGVNDLALLFGDGELSAAAVFTRNLIVAAPIQVSRANLVASSGCIRALIINSGCANAATGDEGLARSRRTIEALAATLGIQPQSVLVNSTGIIGVQLPIDRIEKALPALKESLQSGSCETFARSIMTTDTRPKWASRIIRWMDGATERTCTVTGVAKGAGMIHPNMATMIAVLATDATLTPGELDAHLRTAVEKSFHRISVDGDTSTNDSVFALASHCAGTAPPQQLASAFEAVAQELALMIVRDGEGFERGLEVRVRGCSTQSDALKIARTVAMSLLVRTAVTGGDPNWGRILAAAGRAGVDFDPSILRVSAGGIALFAAGKPTNADLAAVRRAFTADTVRIELDLSMGDSSDVFWSCGLTKRYVEINADYTT